MRLRLPDNAADILSAVDRAVVLTAAYIALLPAHYAADIIADVRVAYRAEIFAVLHRAVGIARYAARVGNVRKALGTVKVVHAEVAKFKRFVVRQGVYRAPILTGADIAAILTDYPSREMLSLYAPRRGAARYRSLTFIDPRYAAAPLVSQYNTRKRAVYNATAVYSRHSAAFFGSARRGQPSAYIKIFYRSAFFYIAEQSRHRYVLRNAKPRNSVTVPIKRTAEAGYGLDTRSHKIYIAFQHKHLSHGIAVKSTVFRELRKFLRGAYTNGIRRVFLPNRGLRIDGNTDKHRLGKQHKSSQNSRRSPIHLRSPPFAPPFPALQYFCFLFSRRYPLQ